MSLKYKDFFNSPAFAVIGASKNREKFGNKVLRCYMENKFVVYPVNPVESQIEGLNCFISIAELPDTVKSISVVTPPTVTEQVVEEAYIKGINNIWMQPGAESKAAIEKCQNYGINCIAGGPCILVELNWEGGTGAKHANETVKYTSISNS